MSSQGTAKATNPSVLLWRSFTQPSKDIVDNQAEESDIVSIDIQQSNQITEEEKKELEKELKKSLERVKTLQENLYVTNFEKIPRVKNSRWNTEKVIQKEAKEQTQSKPEPSNEQEQEIS